MSGILCKDQKGISNLIATLILIGVAVVGGAFAYMAFKGQAQSATSNAQLQVQNLSARNVDGNTYCSVTAKNVGTKQLSNITVAIDPANANIQLSIGTLDPGQTGSADNDSGSLSAGQKYAVRITADTPNGSITKTATVLVKS